jgi:2-keto-4-pentenoate hydratase
MLMSTKANRFAHLLLKSQASGNLLAPLSAAENLSMEDAYDIARCMLNIRIAQGEVPIGRKIGFSNRKMWPLYGTTGPLTEPIWAPLFNTTVEYAEDNFARHTLAKAQQPRIEPELVFKLSRTPEPDITLEGLADCLEWMAHGFEIVVSPFPDWKFEPSDAIAAFGLHRKLIIGEPRMLSAQTRRNLPEVLASASISLSRTSNGSSALCAAGFGADVLDSPLHALWHLHRQLQNQPAFEPLQAGELITTGSWTDAQPIKAGEIWSSAFSQISLQGLHVQLN